MCWICGVWWGQLRQILTNQEQENVNVISVLNYRNWAAHIPASFLSLSFLLLFFLLSFLPSFPPYLLTPRKNSFFPPFLFSFQQVFLFFLLPFLVSSIKFSSFLPSNKHCSFLPASICLFLSSFLPSFKYFFPSFLPPFLPFLSPSFQPVFLLPSLIPVLLSFFLPSHVCWTSDTTRQVH